MNELGMVIDISHAGEQTALDTIQASEAPVTFSHNAAYSVWPTKRTRQDHELKACAEKGGLIGITAVPNSLSNDPKQDINVVLDHFDYMVKLVGVDHVAIGTDTIVGDHVGLHIAMLGKERTVAQPARGLPRCIGITSRRQEYHSWAYQTWILRREYQQDRRGERPFVFPSRNGITTNCGRPGFIDTPAWTLDPPRGDTIVARTRSSFERRMGWQSNWS